MSSATSWTMALAAAALAVVGAAGGAVAAPPAAEWRVAGELPAEPVVRLRDPSVGMAQQRLRRHGYATGRADGRMNEQTRNALRAFQRDCGLPVNGSAITSTAGRLARPAGCPSAGSR